jgi:putative sterol carrier protein
VNNLDQGGIIEFKTQNEFEVDREQKRKVIEDKPLSLKKQSEQLLKNLDKFECSIKKMKYENELIEKRYKDWLKVIRQIYSSRK